MDDWHAETSVAMTGEEPDAASALTFEEDADEESGDAAVPAEQRRLLSQPADPDVEGLHRRKQRGSLVLQASFQRQYVWDATKASRLVESALLGVPIPVIYLAEDADKTVSVIDGQQRLTAFFSFLEGKHPDGTAFKLKGLEVYAELNGKAFADLSGNLQNAILQFPLRTITIQHASDPDVKFRIFERLNTGSMPLNDMELRNCVYRGPYMELLKELAADDAFRRLLGLKGPDKRMRDVELVLRFASFYHATYLHYEKPMKRFFNRDMERHRAITPQDREVLKTRFRNACQVVLSMFGPSAFKRFYAGDRQDPNGRWEGTRFNASLYDVLMGVLCMVDRNQAMGALDRLREAIIDLMVSHQEFIDAIVIGTSDAERVKARFDIMRATVDAVLKETSVQPRCFTRQLKAALYEADPTCGLCGQHIAILDDAAVDHVSQYWRGGQTIPENARLAHRFCNMARPRND